MADAFVDHVSAWDARILKGSKSSNGAFGVGTAGWFVTLGDAGLRSDSTFVVEALEPNRLFSYRSEGLPAGTISLTGKTPPFTKYRTTSRFDAAGGGTTVRIRRGADRSEYPFRVSRITRSTIARGLAAMAERLKTVLGSQPKNFK